MQYGGPLLCEGWRFPTPDGKAHFAVVPLPSVRCTVVIGMSGSLAPSFSAAIFASFHLVTVPAKISLTWRMKIVSNSLKLAGLGTGFESFRLS